MFGIIWNENPSEAVQVCPRSFQVKVARNNRAACYDKQTNKQTTNKQTNKQNKTKQNKQKQTNKQNKQSSYHKIEWWLIQCFEPTILFEIQQENHFV